MQLLRSKSARIFAVGIGPSVDLTEMRMVTEQQDDIFLATEFNDLVSKADTIAKTTCAVVRKFISKLFVQKFLFCYVCRGCSIHFMRAIRTYVDVQ